jgi:hypothetical protein
MDVKSKSVKDLLGPKGWMPTRVRNFEVHTTTDLLSSHLECIFRETLPSWIRFLLLVRTRLTP